MADASFYILNSTTLSERLFFACKLIEKAYRLGQYCYVYMDSKEQCRQLDDQLWTFRANSFVPHQIYDAEQPLPDYQQTVLIGTAMAPEKWQRLIFNLSSKYPDNIPKAKRVLEILDNDDIIKQAGRQRYRQYKRDGFKTIHYDLNKTKTS